MEPDPEVVVSLAGGLQAWRVFFLVAGVWNLLGALGALISPERNLKAFYNLETSDYYIISMNRVIWWLVLIFGVAYLVIAYDPPGHIDLVAMGIAGKILASANWFYLYKKDRATPIAVFAAAGDSAFTLFFIIFLVMHLS